MCELGELKGILQRSKLTVHTIRSKHADLEGTGTHCIDQQAPVTSGKKVLSPDWVTGLEGRLSLAKM
jgi:hypothetical protein